MDVSALNENSNRGSRQTELDSGILKSKLKDLEEINSKSFDPKMAFNYEFMIGLQSMLRRGRNILDFKFVADSLDAGTKIFSSKVDIVQKKTQTISTRF